MSKKSWNPYTCVIVCGVKKGELTDDGSGCQYFNTLFDAQETFPDLNLTCSSARFTSAMGNPEKDVIRFESWLAVKKYSG